MIGARIEGATRLLGKSQGYLGLAVRDTFRQCAVVGGPVPVMITAWEPTDAELAALNAGAKVHLFVDGFTHPPVRVGVGLPPAERETE